MGTKKENLGKLLAELEEISTKEINGKKFDLSINGRTYGDIDKKAKKILAKIHPDVTGSFSKEDQELCNRIAQIVNSVRELMKDYKTANNIKNTDEFTYVQEALDEYHRRHRSRTTGSYSQGTSQRSGAARRSNTQSRGQYTNGRSSERGSYTNSSSSRSSSRSYTKDDELSFSTGILRQSLDSNNNQKQFRFRDGSTIYGYIFKDKNGKVHEIYSENTFEELSNPKIKFEIERYLFTQSNLRKADLYDVQSSESQYGYVGKIYDAGFSMAYHTVNSEILKTLRQATLQETKALKFTTGTLTKRLREDGSQSIHRTKDGSVIYGYVFKDRNGKVHEIYSENTFEELSSPQIKGDIEKHLLSQNSLRNADLYDVQSSESQYGYVGKIYAAGLSMAYHTLNSEIIKERRQAALRKTTSLQFSTGTLTKMVGKDGLQAMYRTKDGSVIYGYVFKDRNGKVHEIYSENTFGELSNPETKFEVEKYLLSQTSLRKANSYDVQSSESQYGYVGKIYDAGLSMVYHKLNREVLKALRQASLKETSKLYFTTGELSRKTDENGMQISHKTRDGIVFGYSFKDRNGKVHEIYSENTFEELSNPQIKLEVERYLLSQGSLKKADSYDVQNSESQYGYVGKIYDAGFSMAYHTIKQDFLKLLRQAYLKETTSLQFESGNLSKKLGQDGKQTFYITKDGSIIYGYSLKDRNGKEHEIYCGNTFEELSNPEAKFDINKFLLSQNSLRRADLYDPQNIESQYGYVGYIRSSPYYTYAINPSHLADLKDRYNHAPIIYVGKNQSGNQDTITLSNGTKLYAYDILRHGDAAGLKRRMFFENTPKEMIKAMQTFVMSGHSKLDMYDILNTCFENCMRQYGYMGRLTKDGIKVNKEISREVRDRFEKIKAKRKFEELMSKEAMYAKNLKDMVDPR